LTMRTTSSLKLASNFLRFFVINHSLNKSMIHLSRCLCKLNHYTAPWRFQPAQSLHAHEKSQRREESLLPPLAW
jgi:hypothetical protein